MRTATLLAATSLGLATLIATPALAQDNEVKVFGRIMLDHTFASADEADEDFSVTEARRLRLGLSGKFGSDVKYKFELNTDSSGDVNAEDAYAQWYPTGDSWSVIVGQDNTHNSFHELASSRFLMAERAAFTDAFGFDRRLGISVLNDGDNWTAAAGVHTVNLENDNLNSGWAASARGTYTPINTDDTLVHVGAHWRYRNQGEDDGLIRYRQRPLSHGLDRIVSTGNIADEDTLIGLEAYGLAQGGKYWVGSEYSFLEAESSPGGIAEDANFGGGMITAGTMLGGRRTYKNGKWDRPKVDSPVGDGGMGALLLEARYDTLDLEDDAVDGGELDTWALHADWYLTKYVHFGATGFVSDADLGTVTSGLGSDFADLVRAGVPSEDVTGIVFRLNVDFGSPTWKF